MTVNRLIAALETMKKQVGGDSEVAIVDTEFGINSHIQLKYPIVGDFRDRGGLAFKCAFVGGHGGIEFTKNGVPFRKWDPVTDKIDYDGAKEEEKYLVFKSCMEWIAVFIMPNIPYRSGLECHGEARRWSIVVTDSDIMLNGKVVANRLGGELAINVEEMDGVMDNFLMEWKDTKKRLVEISKSMAKEYHDNGR